MTRAALYARYSDDKQSEASIEDQFRLCREHAGRERWQIVGSYEDAAISGASTILRPGIQRLMRDAQHGDFNILLAEALDRISRDQADTATLYKHLKFAGVTIVTLAEGEISELHVGLKGTMNALFLKDLAMKTHRGLRGRVEKGKAGGGLCYGYKVLKKLDGNGEPIRGDREIIPEEAEVVRRIFREFASGKSPKTIAVDLNKEGIPGPLGRAWGDTSIRGHRNRGTGIVNNELYAGVLVWNRLRFVKDPSTGKRVSRPNPESAWIRTEVPHLRIVDDALWNAVRERQKQIGEIFGPNLANTREGRAKRLHLANRPVSLLSGLLTCGCCGGKVGIILSNRLGCLNHHRRGTCTNNRTILRDKLEARVLAGLQDRLVSAETVEEAVRAYVEETNRLNHQRRAQQDTDRRALAKIERAITGIIAAIEDGMYQPSMKARMDELERQKVEIAARMAGAPADVPDVHPNVAANYSRNVARFAEALNDPDGGREAAEALRSLIGEVIVTPGEKRGEVHAELRGELMGILGIAAAQPEQGRTGLMLPVAARPRNHRYRQTRRSNGGFFRFGSLSNGLLLRPFEDRAQFAVQRGVEFPPFRAGSQHNLLDRNAQILRRFLPLFRPVQGLRQRDDLLGVDGRSTRQNVRRVRRRIGEQSRQFFPARFQPGHLLLHRRMIHAVCNGLDDLRDLLLDLHQFGLPGIAVRAAFPVQPVCFLRIGAHGVLDDLRRHHPVLQSGKHTPLQIFARNAPAVGAGTLADMVRAGEAVGAAQRVGTAAAAAEHQPRQQRLGTARAVQPVLLVMRAHGLGDIGELLGDLALPLTHRLPEFVVDDPQIGNVLDDPFRFRVQARDAPSG